jgi:murein DD-endopeptidase MepM/ murein hydrolase activator NlpD
MNDGCIVIETSHEGDNHKAEVEYCNISFKDGLKVGDSVKQDDEIGKVKGPITESVNGGDESTIKGQFHLGLILDGQYTDPTYLLNIEKMLLMQNGTYSDSDSNMKIASNETNKKWAKYYDANADFVDEWLNANPINFTNAQTLLTSMAPIQTSINSAFGNRILDGKPNYHAGIDIGQYGNFGSCPNGIKYCKHFYAGGNGAIIEIVDGNPDNVGHLVSGAAGNYTRVMYRGTDGNLYLMLYYHDHKGSLTGTTGKLDIPLVQKGEWIGTSGTSGYSTGVHIHFEVLNLGKRTFKEAWDIIKAKGVYAGLNKNNTGVHCVNTGGRTPCVVDTTKEKGAQHYNQYTPTREQECNLFLGQSKRGGLSTGVQKVYDSCPEDSPAKTGKSDYITKLKNMTGPLTENQQEFLQMFG